MLNTHIVTFITLSRDVLGGLSMRRTGCAYRERGWGLGRGYGGAAR